MVDVLDLYDELHESGVKFYSWNLEDDKSALLEMNGQYAVFIDFANICTTAEELVVVAHESGHIHTGTTHRVYSPFDLVERHENVANKYAIKKLVSKRELDDATAAGCTEIWSLAEYFNVTENFMRKAVCLYQHGNLAVDYYCP